MKKIKILAFSLLVMGIGMVVSLAGLIAWGGAVGLSIVNKAMSGHVEIIKPSQSIHRQIGNAYAAIAGKHRISIELRDPKPSEGKGPPHPRTISITYNLWEVEMVRSPDRDANRFDFEGDIRNVYIGPGNKTAVVYWDVPGH